MGTYEQAYVEKVAAERGKQAAGQTRYMLTKFGLTGPTGKELDEARTRLIASLAPASANRIMGAVRSYLHWCRSTERMNIPRETIQDVLKEFREEKLKIELPELPQIRRLWELVLESSPVKRTARARLVALCMFAGLRPGEAENIKPSDFKREYLTVKASKTGVERHVYTNHSAVLRPLMLRMAALPEIMPRKPRQWLSAAFKEAGWSDCTRNTLRKLCVSFCACKGVFSEYQLAQQFGHSQIVSMEHYRDRRVLGMIKDGGCIEEWMGLGDMVDQMKVAVIGG